MEVEAYVLLEEVKTLNKKAKYRKVITKIESYVEKQKQKINREHYYMVEILLQQIIGITKVLFSIIEKKRKQEKEKIVKMMLIVQRNLRLCYYSIRYKLKESIGYLVYMIHIQNQQQHFKMNCGTQEVKKIYKKFMDILIEYYYNLITYFKIADHKVQYKEVLKLIMKISTNFFDFNTKNFEIKLFIYQIHILFINQIDEISELEVYYPQLLVIFQFAFQELQLFALRPKNENLLKKINKIILISLLSLIKVNIKLNKFYQAKQSIKLLTFLSNKFSLDSTFKKHLMVGSIITKLEKQAEIKKETIIKEFISSSLYIKNLIKSKNRGFDINEFYVKKFKKISQTRQKKGKTLNKIKINKIQEDRKIISMLIDGIEEQDHQRQSFLNSNINSQISMINMNYKKQKLKQRKTGSIISQKSKKLLRKNYDETQQNKTYHFCFGQKKQQLKKKSKEKENNLLEISQLYTNCSQMIKKYEKKKKIKDKKVDKEEQIEKEEENKNKVELLLQILKYNKNKLRIVKYVEKLNIVNNRKQDKMKKSPEIENQINIHLQNIALGRCFLSRRKNKIKTNNSVNIYNQFMAKSWENHEYILTKNQKKSKESVEYYLKKNINYQHKLKEKQIIKKSHKHYHVFQSQFNPLF